MARSRTGTRSRARWRRYTRVIQASSWIAHPSALLHSVPLIFGDTWIFWSMRAGEKDQSAGDFGHWPSGVRMPTGKAIKGKVPNQKLALRNALVTMRECCTGTLFLSRVVRFLLAQDIPLPVEKRKGAAH